MPVNLSLAPLTLYPEQVSKNVLSSPSVLWEEAGCEWKAFMPCVCCVVLGMPLPLGLVFKIGLIISA